MRKSSKSESIRNNVTQIKIEEGEISPNTNTEASDNTTALIEDMNAQPFSWNAGYVIEMIDTGLMDLDILIQRGSVWNHRKDSLLISSILTLTPIQNCYMNKIDGVYGVVDGKQRLTAVHSFVKGKYKLHPATPPIKVNGMIFKIAGYNFESLPKSLQNRILNYSIRGDWFDNLAAEKEIEFFVLTNSGKPVSAAEISRSRVKSKKTFISLSEHNAMVLAINESNKKKRKNIDILTQLWCLCYGKASSLLQKEMSPMLSETEVTEDQKNELVKVLDYALEYYKDIRNDKKRLTKMQKPTHILSLFYMAFLAFQKRMDVNEFVEKAKLMFNGEGRMVTNNELYNSSVISGSSKAEQVSIRLDEIEKALD